jgi:4-amino-4-deoxy-L-arabinose transferase-like glycosyltransferase
MTEAAAPASSFLTRLAKRPALSLFLLCLVVWLPGIFVLPPLDRDESRFAQASKQMVESGDFVDIRFGAGARYNKPVGIYWLQAASAKIFGGKAHDQIWPYRIPSFVGGFIALLFLFWCVRAFASAEIAFASAALLGTSVAMTAETQIATTDAVLLAATLGAQAVLFRIYLAAREPARQAPGHGVVLAGWFAFAVGILVKGPVIAGVLGVTALAVSLWDRDWRWLKRTLPLQGLLVIALVVLPWAIAIAVQSHGAFYKQSLGHDFANKLVSGQESHGEPPGYYLALATLTLWPASLFVAPGLRAAWRDREQAAMRYLLAWAAATWLMFEIVPTKLPHYILPAYPALVILAACWALEMRVAYRTRLRLSLRILAGLQFLVGLAVFVLIAFIAPLKFGDGVSWPLTAIAVVGCAIGIFALVAYWRERQSQAMLASLAAALVLVPLLTFGVAPRLGALWVSPRAAALVAKDRRPGDPPPVIAGYVEPSLIFLLGTETRAGTGADAAHIAAQQGGLALIDDRQRSAFLAGLGALDTQAFPVDSIAGYDYSHGRKTHVTIYRVVPQAQPSTPSSE